MKSIHCVMSHRHFDNQYTFDLDGFMTAQEFASTMTAFNEVAQHNPPPPSLSSGTSTALIASFSTLIILTVIGSIHYTHHLYFILVIPFTLISFSCILMGWRRRLKKKFEHAIIHLCSCMNATENVRGINFRLSKLSPGSNSSTHYQKSAYYAITIEFDERYNLLHHFSTMNGSNYKSICSPPAYSQSSPTIPQTSYQPNEKL
ncbi:uncharacterized protein BX664DRAFT_360082 [Halteromyces radiatus]|uniref:uncharacterized protein n=1 Tax=Halteromyces radiatus TaxID=101107 RepID=UPI00222111C3|nr:uncharacterized protein BX664DRAFT_360082 [Halteromyces radiatus]KAI8086558.1 hypothetical protein BX664DRAFT_360082 [Halteromyces radiatus]